MAHRPSGYLKVGAEEYSRLALAIDRLLIENEPVADMRPLPVRARRSSRNRLRLIRGLVPGLLPGIMAGLDLT